MWCVANLRSLIPDDLFVWRHNYSMFLSFPVSCTPFPFLFLPIDLPELQSVPLLARSPSTNRKYPPLPVDKLEEEMNRRMADDNKLFREEFNVNTLRVRKRSHMNHCDKM